MKSSRRWSVLVHLALVLAAASAARAGEGEVTVEELRRRMDGMQRKHEEEIRSIRAELERLRGSPGGPAAPAGAGIAEQMEDYVERLESMEKRVLEFAKPKAKVRLLDLSVVGIFAVGASTATDAQLLDLQGGGHDPHKRGFTVENVELSATGAVDPYFTAESHIVFAITPEGETAVELEEMFLVTTALPHGLQVKAGQFFTEFGRLNAIHPHAWDFVDQPVVNTRMFGGDGMRGPGARVSWLAPTSFPLEVFAAAQNANGETMVSFNGEAGEPLVGGHLGVSGDVRAPDDLLYTGRMAASFDLSPATVVLPGASCAFGPNGSGGRTRIDGVDLTLRWKPESAQAGFPFVTWQTEWMRRRYAADTVSDPSPGGFGFVPGNVLHDRGAYTQVTWGFTRGWALGARWDWCDGSGGGAGADPARDLRTRGALALTWFPSEFSRLRLQVDRDRSGALGRSAVAVWLQWEIAFGAHGAHRF